MFGLIKKIGSQTTILSNKSISTTSCLRDQINQHKPTNLEKRFLVWTKKYKSVDEVPSHVSYEIMERCKSKVRIRFTNYFMIIASVGCIVMVISGKNAMGRGESVTKQNLDWHKKYNEDKAKEEAAAKAAH
ncbi:UPF0389 protein CG9231 isoform X2 [Condylostylus longicornis]|uniref:UPF0389 protein CG9231 isoform X2 n=1 Tax=Condylostylus longicornis TaxID=2530218 RepID=UPI00244D9B39|nr:UPF0389 protein CG9231 isoform X2 [Condylostylus longicornis]